MTKILNIWELRKIYEQLYKDFTEQTKEKNDSLTIRESLEFAYSKTTLKKIEQLLNHNENELPAEVKIFLDEHWDTFKSSYLCYTSLPKNKVNLFLCDLAIYASNRLNQDENFIPFGAVNLLMPSVETESQSNDWPHLGTYSSFSENNELEYYVNTQVDPKLVIQTHILSDCEQYLIPVMSLPEILEKDNRLKCFNHYYNMDVHASTAACLTKNEIYRVELHSVLTSNLKTAYTGYKINSRMGNHLLARLNRLCNFLYANSMMILGEEERASEGVYSAIIEFQEYYDLLHKKGQGGKVPSDVKLQIQHLLDISSSIKHNNDETEASSICIASRREELLRCIKTHEVVLSQISLDAQQNNKLILDAKARYESVLNFFTKQPYNQGADRLSITVSCLQKINNFRLEVNDWNSLLPLGALDAKDIEALLSVEKLLTNDILDQLMSVESLNKLAFSISPSPFGAILFYIKEELVERGILSRGMHIGQLVFGLLPEKQFAVVQSLDSTISYVTHSYDDLYDVLLHLKHDSRMVVLKSVSNYCAIFDDTHNQHNVKYLLKNNDEEKQIFRTLVQKQDRMRVNIRQRSLYQRTRTWSTQQRVQLSVHADTSDEETDFFSSGSMSDDETRSDVANYSSDEHSGEEHIRVRERPEANSDEDLEDSRPIQFLRINSQTHGFGFFGRAHDVGPNIQNTQENDIPEP